MRVYMSVDAEGISGIIKLAQVLPGDPSYDFARRMMVNDVNAAIRGAANAGATEIIVNDAHNSGDNIFIDQLDSRAKLISGSDRPLVMMEGISRGFDAAFLIGYHTRKGTKGVISHSWSYGSMVEISINNKPIGEFELNGLLAGHFNVPVVFVSGDNELVASAEAVVSGIHATITKEAISGGSALCYHPAVTAKAIEETSCRALQQRDQIKPMKLEGNAIELEIQFASYGAARYAATLDGFEIVNDARVRYVGSDYLDVYLKFVAASAISSSFKDR